MCESTLTIIYLVSLSIQVPQNRCCSIFLSFNSQQRYNELISYQQLTLFFCVIRIGKRKCGKLGRRQQLKTFIFGGIDGGSTNPENGFLFPNFLRRSVLDAPTRDYRQFRSGGYQITTMPYTNNNGHGPGYHHQQSHSVGGTIAASNILFPLNVDFHTGQQQQFLHSSNLPLNFTAT